MALFVGKGPRKKVLWALVFNEGFCINKLTFYTPVMTKSSRRDEFMPLYGYLCMLSYRFLEACKNYCSFQI